MIQAQVLDSLKEVAKSDKALDATLTMFAARERARHSVTLRGLKQRMAGEGWKEFDEHDYKRVLKVLAEHGIGKLQKDSSGRVTAITEVRVALQSLGQAVMSGGRKAIENWKPRNKFIPAPATPKVKAEEQPTFNRRSSDKIDITAQTMQVQFNGKPLEVHIPKSFTAQEIADFIVNLQSWKPASRDNHGTK